MSYGIVDRIKRADTVSEVKNLRQELEGYDYASDKTRRRAERWATARIAHLKSKVG